MAGHIFDNLVNFPRLLLPDNVRASHRRAAWGKDMTRPFRALAPCIRVTVATGTVAMLLAGTVQADPARQLRLDPRLGALLGQEQAALGAVAPGHVEKILGGAGPGAAGEVRATAPPGRQVGGDEIACLARAVYHEARGEGETGMRAVAEVVLNRVESRRFPGSICGVVYQGLDNPAGCQFSFACDGSEAASLEPRAWARAAVIAREMVAGAPRPLTDGATHFHTVAVNPNWAQVYPMTAEIGAHRFYRKPVRVATN